MAQNERRGKSIAKRMALINARSGMTLVELIVAIAIATILFGGLIAAFRATQFSDRTCEEQMELVRTARIAIERISSDLRSCYPMQVQLPEEVMRYGSMSLRQSSSTERATPYRVFHPSTPSNATGALNTILTFLTEDIHNERLQLDQDSLRFTATANDPRSHEQPSYDLIEIAYYIDIDPTTQEEGLIRAVGLLPGLLSDGATVDGEQKVSMLSQNIWMLNFRYFDDANSEWLDEWQDFEKLPAAVEVTVGIFPPSYLEELRSNRSERLLPAMILSTIVPITVRHMPTALTLERVQQNQTQQPSQGQQGSSGETISAEGQEQQGAQVSR